jgi:hypothetical protein
VAASFPSVSDLTALSNELLEAPLPLSLSLSPPPSPPLSTEAQRQVVNRAPHNLPWKKKEKEKRDKSLEQRLNLSRSWHKGHSHTYNTLFPI